MKYYLTILGIFKNEAMVIKEWIDHYIWQGVEHFYLVNNDSSDNYLEVIQPYINDGYITLYHLPEKHKQEDHYNTIFEKIKDKTEWLIPCDIDEYWFGINKPLVNFLKSLDPKIDLVRTQWFTLGSNGHDKQPPSIRLGFTTGTYDRPDETLNVTKAIVKPEFVKRLGPHCHFHKNDKVATFKIDGGYQFYDPDLIGWNFIFVNSNEIKLFHYQIMSKEYYEKVKMTRGDNVSHEWDTLRTWDYFYARDKGDIEDKTLYNLIINGYSQ